MAFRTFNPQIPASKSKIVFEALPQDDPKIRQPDISLAQSLLAGSRKCRGARVEEDVEIV